MDVLQFTLKNDTSRFLAYNYYYCHNTGHSFEPMFMKFTRLVQIHTWVNPIFLVNNRSKEPLIRGKCAPKNGFLIFIQPIRRFLRKKFQRRILYIISHEKVIFIFVVLCPIPWKMVMPPFKNFLWLFWKILFICFFWKNCCMKNIRKPNFFQKSLY